MFYTLNGGAIGPAPKQGPAAGAARTAGTKGFAPKQRPPAGAGPAGTKPAGGGVWGALTSGAGTLFTGAQQVAPTALQTYEQVQAARGRPGLGLDLYGPRPSLPSWFWPVAVVVVVGGVLYLRWKKA